MYSAVHARVPEQSEEDKIDLQEMADRQEWEAEQAQFEADARKEWEAEQIAFAEKDGVPFVLDEEHDDMGSISGVLSRLAIKTARGTDEETISYLSKEHPKMEFGIEDGSGDVIVRKKKGEKAWRKLDASKQSMSDITDVIGDLAASGLEATAATAGGLVGGSIGLIGGPWGAAAGGLTGASIGGGAGAYTADAIRQGLGNMMGTMDGFDNETAKNAGLWGVMSGPLLGAGTTSKAATKFAMSKAGRNLMKKGAEKMGSPADALETLMKSQRGLLGHGWAGGKKLAGGTGALLSGVDKDIVNWAYDNIDKIKAAEQSVESRADIFKQLHETLETSSKKQRGEVGNEIGRIIEDAGQDGGLLNIRDARRNFDALVDRYEAKAKSSPTKENIDNAKLVRQERHDLFESTKGNLDIDSQLMGDDVPINGEFVDYRSIDDSLDLKDLLNDRSGIRKATLKPAYANASDTVLRDIERAASADAQQLVKTISDAIPDEYGALKKKYADMIDVDKILRNRFKTPEKANSTMNTIFNPGKDVARDDVMRASKVLGEDIFDKAKEVTAVGIYAKPEDVLGGFLKDKKRRIPAAGVGALGGYLAGDTLSGETDEVSGFSARAGLAAVGAGAGAMAFGPRAMRKYMTTHRKAAKGWSMLQQTPIVPVPWSPAALQTGINANEQAAMRTNKGQRARDAEAQRLEDAKNAQ